MRRLRIRQPTWLSVATTLSLVYRCATHKANAVDTRVCIDAARFPFEASSTAFRKALERGSGQCASDDGAAGAATLRISGTIRLATTKAIMIRERRRHRRGSRPRDRQGATAATT